MKSLLFTIGMLVVFTNALFAQSTTIKLPTADTTSSFVVTDNNNNVIMKMFGWDAFRVGSVISAPIGQYSIALGFNPIASGNYSTAMGDGAIASGNSSTAVGSNTEASGIVSTAIGLATTASGNYSTAMGWGTTASGIASTAMGDGAIASGDYSTAIGYDVSTNGATGAGCCIIGDKSTRSRLFSSNPNQMMAIFDGGYQFFTKADYTTSVYLINGSNAWSTTSDSTKKEHFAKADGEYFLQSISQIRLGSWNYKKQDAQHFRHYGPMAQDVYHYFGKDTYGTIGNDTSLATADMDGIEMICLQALERRTSELQKATAKIAELEKRTSELQAAQEKISALETSLNKLSTVVQTLVDEKKNVSMNVVERKDQ